MKFGFENVRKHAAFQETSTCFHCAGVKYDFAHLYGF